MYTLLQDVSVEYISLWNLMDSNIIHAQLKFEFLHWTWKWSSITRNQNHPGANLIQKFTLPLGNGFLLT